MNVTSANATIRTISPTHAETWIVTLGYDPTADGAVTRSLDISSNDAGTPVAHVALGGTGATPSIALNVSARTVFPITWLDSYPAFLTLPVCGATGCSGAAGAQSSPGL